MDSINNRLEKGINILIKNKLDLVNNLKKFKYNKNLLKNSNFNHSSNCKLNTFNNENVLYKNKLLNTPLKDKILKDINKEKGIILPEIKTPSIKRNNININTNIFYHFTKIPKESLINNTNNINNEPRSEITSDKTSFFRNIKLNKIINKNNNDQTTQSVTSSTKNQTNSKNNIIPNINEDGNKYEIGLIPTGSTTNSNIMIPILNLKSPLIHKKKITENDIENENIKNEKLYDNEIVNCHISHNSRNKICKRKESKERINISMKNKELFNLLSGIQKVMPNFHKIKIEKGMITSNINKNISSYSNKLTFDYKNKNNINFNDNNLKIKSFNNS